MKKIILLLTLIISSAAYATSPKLISSSQQLIIVSTADLNAATGEMQRYERNSTKSPWKSVGTAIPVVVGKNGMAWDAHFSKLAPVKQEGDGRTPIGIYKIGPEFGFDAKTHNNIEYFPLTDTSVCVDDVKSAYYNQLIDSAKVPKKDWNSGEQMRQVAQYQYGSVIQYNHNKPTAGAGSCIFMHIWKNSTHGTAGCVAMEEANLKNTLSWLNKNKHPVIAMIPQSVYAQVKTEWKLP